MRCTLHRALATSQIGSQVRNLLLKRMNVRLGSKNIIRNTGGKVTHASTVQGRQHWKLGKKLFLHFPNSCSAFFQTSWARITPNDWELALASGEQAQPPIQAVPRPSWLLAEAREEECLEEEVLVDLGFAVGP